jgi:hypothetical protein
MRAVTTNLELLHCFVARVQLIPDPGIVIPEAMAEVVQRLQLTKTYDPDVLMRQVLYGSDGLHA